MADIWFDVDTALSEVPVNIFPLTDDTDFKTRETAVAYNAAGMDLVWNFVTTAGAMSQTAVTPTTGGAYDWAHQGDGMYTIEIPASGGASINNDTEGFGWFTGMATGVLPWRSPVYGFRAAALNNALIDGGDLLDVNVTHIADTTQTGRDIGASVLLSSGTGTGQISLSSGAVTAGTVSDKTGYSLSVTPPTAAAIADAVWDETITSGHGGVGSSGLTLVDALGYASATRTALTDNRAAALDRIVGTLAEGTHSPQTGDSYAIVNNGTYGNSAIETLVDDLETRLTATRAGYLDNLITAPPSASDIATAVWAAGTRTLSSFGSLVADIATAVWGAVARTITGGTITTNSDKTGYALTGTDIADIKSVTVKLDTAMELDGAVYRFTTNALEEAPSSSGGDATAANQTIIINHLTDVKGATFSGDTDSLEAIRNRGDVAWITGGTGGGSSAVTINVKDNSAVNVVDCYVEVWDSAGTSFISRTNTNSSGNVTFNLDNNTYTVKMHKTGYYFANQTLTVDGVESVAYTGTILTPTAPTDPTLCKVYGYYFDPSGNTFPAIKSMVKMSVAYEAADNNYYVESINGTYNTTTGELSFSIVQGADAVLDIPFLNIKKRFTVPAETLYKISDII